jgi:hypothetical protein
MSLVAVVNRQPLAEFSGRGPYYMIAACVVRGITPKDIDPNGAFLELVRRTFQSLLNDVAKEGNRPHAGPENLVCNQLVELVPNHLLARPGSLLDFDC